MPEPADSNRLLTTAARTIDRRDAEFLLAACWGKSRSQLLAAIGDAVPAGVASRFEEMRRRRADGVPVAYLLGRREFWSMDFSVDPAVLVPRPETELLVQRVLDLVPSTEAHVADLGTGSGAIAIAMAYERPRWRVTGTDASAAALEVARANGERLVRGRVEWAQGDWYGALGDRRFEALVSNPPYIAGDDPVLSGDSLAHEPRTALTPEGDGFAALATLINGAPGHLEPGGWLVLENGTTQAETLR
jgi:release factor glutamine methyltransferase